MTGKRNGEIDAFRFVFAIVIFLFHFGVFLQNSALKNVFKFGNIGVEFFFLVSGYLLAARACRFAASERARERERERERDGIRRDFR